MKKAWRDAASLILVTGPFRYSRPPLPRSLLRSASVTPVVLEEHGGKGGGEGGGGGGGGGCEDDMRLLFVKRNSKSGFMVGMCLKLRMVEHDRYMSHVFVVSLGYVISPIPGFPGHAPTWFPGHAPQLSLQPCMKVEGRLVVPYKGSRGLGLGTRLAKCGCG